MNAICWEGERQRGELQHKEHADRIREQSDENELISVILISLSSHRLGVERGLVVKLQQREIRSPAMCDRAV